jgi:cytidylate kinase
MKLILSGLAASGKTTLAKFLAKRLNIKFYTASKFFYQIARKEGFNPKGKNWFDSQEGIKFLKYRLKNQKLDKELDKKILKMLEKKEKFIITSWILPWVFKGSCIKIWLEASPEERIKRLAKRSKISFSKAKRIIQLRDSLNKKLYKKAYGVEIGPDKNIFNLIIETSGMEVEELGNKILNFLFKHQSLR